MIFGNSINHGKPRPASPSGPGSWIVRYQSTSIDTRNLEEFEISALFAALVTAYPGADMFLELLAPGVVGSRYHDTDNTMNAGFKWSILNSRDLKAVHSKLQFVDEWCVLDFFRERWAWIGKYADFPMFRNYFGEKIVHVKFR